MIEYIYFVKCPNCEDEHFDFFNDAKEFALGCLSQKPIITQIEVDRNDFGVCVNSNDLGTVWSWEDVMQDVPADEATTLSKSDTFDCPDCDQEFDALDNSIDDASDSFVKPVPTDMTIEALVEEMEENEDIVECKWCDELFDKSECRYEVDLGWLCDRCQSAIMSRGETLTFREGPLEESMFNKNAEVEFEYYDLQVTLQGPKRDVDDWDEADDTVRFVYTKNKVDVATDIWENFITEEDVSDVPGGLEYLEDDHEWEAFLETHFDILLDKYYDQLLEYYRDDAARLYEETYSLGESCATKDRSILDEAADPEDLVELEYNNLAIMVNGPKRDVDDWDEFEHTDNYVYLVPRDEVAAAIWENWITEEDVADVPDGLEALEDDREWDIFLETHFDTLFEKYHTQILRYFEDAAAEEFQERYSEDRIYEEGLDKKYFSKVRKAKSFLEEFEESDEYRKRLVDCPECGVSQSFDHETGFCINCGFNI